MKDPVLLNTIGAEVAEKYGVIFLPSEFRKKGGYLRSIELSKEYDLYRQDYCGCVYSKLEMEQRRKSKEETEQNNL
jgi:predicted adenine nucleotide alpha hydrolase (AANH) superfamily ATPase